jgi:hypothetical protein
MLAGWQRNNNCRCWSTPHSRKHHWPHAQLKQLTCRWYVFMPMAPGAIRSSVDTEYTLQSQPTTDGQAVAPQQWHKTCSIQMHWREQALTSRRAARTAVPQLGPLVPHTTGWWWPAPAAKAEAVAAGVGGGEARCGLQGGCAGSQAYQGALWTDCGACRGQETAKHAERAQNIACKAHRVWAVGHSQCVRHDGRWIAARGPCRAEFAPQMADHWRSLTGAFWRWTGLQVPAEIDQVGSTCGTPSCAAGILLAQWND